MEKKLYLVVKPSAYETKTPLYYYTFAQSKEEAIYKVDTKWGDIDPKVFARELRLEELDELIITTNNYG